MKESEFLKIAAPFIIQEDEFHIVLKTRVFRFNDSSLNIDYIKFVKKGNLLYLFNDNLISKKQIGFLNLKDLKTISFIDNTYFDDVINNERQISEMGSRKTEN